MIQYKIGRAIGIIVIVFCGAFLAMSCSAPKIPALWANGFNNANAGFDRLTVFIDFTAIRADLSGKVFLPVKESLTDAKDLDDAIKENLTAKGYTIASRNHYFVGSYLQDPMNATLESDKSSALKNPPFHIDPEVSRVPQHQKDVLDAMKLFAAMIPAEDSVLAAATLPKEISQRIGAHYHSSGILLAIGQARRIKDQGKTWPPLTDERVLKTRTSFLAIGFFEATTGRLVFFQRTQIEGSQDLDRFRKTLAGFLEPFPPKPENSTFEIPSVSKDDAGPAALAPFEAPASEIIPNTDAANVMAVLKGRGYIQFTKFPSASKSDTTVLPPGTPVRIIGKTEVYTKVVLEDGTVGWVPTSAVWIRK